MASPLIGLPKTIGKALSGVFFDAVLARDVAAAGANAWTPGTITTTEYACKGLNDAWSSYQRAGGLVAGADRKILILASTLAVTPQEGDRITIQGATLTLVSDGGSQPAVTTDPATAVWMCRGRV
ncbi:hypothetical protein V5G24_20355 [Xanthobacter sp. VTT E-85241]|uniref:hypothetical protein n=1 Tax=Roseixanthobacter finlandensis TaxID=3119922 RepID=UPI00372920DB